MEMIKVAIADANSLLREGLKRILSAERDLLVVGEAADDDEVRETVEVTRPDVLLLDLKIPKREAVPTLIELQQKNAPTAVLILSLEPEMEAILNTAKAGACGYFLKRSSPATLVQAIRRIHSGDIWVDRQLGCAETFVKFARQIRTDNAGELENEIAGALSKREMEILSLVAKGLTNRVISKTLFISESTVKIHINHIFNKLNVSNRTQAALLLVNAYQEGLREEPAWGVQNVERSANPLPERRVARLIPAAVSPARRSI